MDFSRRGCKGLAAFKAVPVSLLLFGGSTPLLLNTSTALRLGAGTGYHRGSLTNSF